MIRESRLPTTAFQQGELASVLFQTVEMGNSLNLGHLCETQRQHPAGFTEDKIYYNALTHPAAQDLGALKSVHICNLGKTFHVNVFSFGYMSQTISRYRNSLSLFYFFSSNNLAI
jgi:hypothetical protein